MGRGQHSLDLLLWREVAVGVPGDALGGDLVVLAEELEGVGAGGGIVLLVGEGCGFAGGLFFHAETTIDDGEDVVRGEVVGIDGLEVFVLDAGFVVFALLVEGEAEFAVGVAGAWELGDDFAEVGDGVIEVALIAFDESEVVEGAGVVGAELERLVESGAGVVVALPVRSRRWRCW